MCVGIYNGGICWNGLFRGLQKKQYDVKQQRYKLLNLFFLETVLLTLTFGAFGGDSINIDFSEKIQTFTFTATKNIQSKVKALKITFQGSFKQRVVCRLNLGRRRVLHQQIVNFGFELFVGSVLKADQRHFQAAPVLLRHKDLICKTLLALKIIWTKYKF